MGRGSAHKLMYMLQVAINVLRMYYVCMYVGIRKAVDRNQSCSIWIIYKTKIMYHHFIGLNHSTTNNLLVSLFRGKFFSFIFFLEQSIAQAVVHSLDLGVVLKSIRTELTANAGLLEATEGSLVRDHVVVVDPYGATIELALLQQCT